MYQVMNSFVEVLYYHMNSHYKSISEKSNSGFTELVTLSVPVAYTMILAYTIFNNMVDTVIVLTKNSRYATFDCNFKNFLLKTL